MKIVIDNKIPFIKGHLENIAENVIYLPGAEITASDVKDADVLIVRTRTICNKELLEGSKVRLIITATIGYDHIDTFYCDTFGIKWTNCPGCNAKSVSTYVHNALTALGKLNKGMTIGVIGVGHVGKLVVEDCLKEGLNVLMCDPPRAERGESEAGMGFTTLDDICENADIITFHTPLCKCGKYATYHLADKEFFDKLKKKPVFINASRGSVVDGDELKKAIKEGKISNTVIDVWENEPNVDTELIELVDIATPHIAGYSANGKLNATKTAIMAVKHFIACDNSIDESKRIQIAMRSFKIDLPVAPKLTPETLIDDSMKFKKSPKSFEEQRGNYPTRVE